MNPFQERKGVMKAIHRLAHAKEPAAKIRRDKEPVECRACGETAMREEWRDNLYICPHCGNHRGMTAGFASPRIPEAFGNLAAAFAAAIRWVSPDIPRRFRECGIKQISTMRW